MIPRCEPVGDFPQVSLGLKSLVTQIFTAFGAARAPILSGKGSRNPNKSRGLGNYPPAFGGVTSGPWTSCIGVVVYQHTKSRTRRSP